MTPEQRKAVETIFRSLSAGFAIDPLTVKAGLILDALEKAGMEVVFVQPDRGEALILEGVRLLLLRATAGLPTPAEQDWLAKTGDQ